MCTAVPVLLQVAQFCEYSSYCALFSSRSAHIRADSRIPIKGLLGNIREHVMFPKTKLVNSGRKIREHVITNIYLSSSQA